MATAKHIYVVRPKAEGAPSRLVRATNASRALAHVVKDTMTVYLAAQDDLVLLAPKTKVEDAGAGDNDGEPL